MQSDRGLLWMWGACNGIIKEGSCECEELVTA
jgi:hypothetical protein